MVVIVITASIFFRVIISKAGSRGSAGCSATGSISIPALRAPASDAFDEQFCEGIALVCESRNAASGWKQLSGQLDDLADDFGRASRETGDVAARPGKAGDKAARHRVADLSHHDGNFACGLFRRQGSRSLEYNNDIDS